VPLCDSRGSGRCEGHACCRCGRPITAGWTGYAAGCVRYPGTDCGWAGSEIAQLDGDRRAAPPTRLRTPVRRQCLMLVIRPLGRASCRIRGNFRWLHRWLRANPSLSARLSPHNDPVKDPHQIGRGEAACRARNQRFAVFETRVKELFGTRSGSPPLKRAIPWEILLRPPVGGSKRPGPEAVGRRSSPRSASRQPAPAVSFPPAHRRRG